MALFLHPDTFDETLARSPHYWPKVDGSIGTYKNLYEIGLDESVPRGHVLFSGQYFYLLPEVNRSVWDYLLDNEVEF